MQVTLPCKLSYELFVPRGCVLRNTLCAKGPTARYSLQHLNMIIKYIENDWYILNTTILLLLSICGHHCALQTSNTSKKMPRSRGPNLDIWICKCQLAQAIFSWPMMANVDQPCTLYNIIQPITTPFKSSPLALDLQPKVRYFRSCLHWTANQNAVECRRSCRQGGWLSCCKRNSEMIWKSLKNIWKYCAILQMR